MLGKRTLTVYYYLDSDGIDSLYAQTVKRAETEYSQSREKGKAGSFKARIGIGRLLSSLLGLTEIDTEAGVSLSGKYIEEVKFRLTIEQKLAALSHYFSKFTTNVCFDNLVRAAVHCTETGEGVFINTKERFNAPQFYCYPDGVAEVNKTKGIILEIGPPRDDLYDYSDNYYKHRCYHFFMSASLKKFTRIYGEEMEYTSHEALLFRAYGGKNIPVGVFGYLTQLGKYTFQIKPFALWR